MMIWIGLKWLADKIKKGLIMVGKFLIGWLILGRSCKRCTLYRRKPYERAVHCAIYLYSEPECSLLPKDKAACKNSITRKWFEKEEYYR